LFSHQRSFIGYEIILEGQCALEVQAPWCEFISDSVISLTLHNIYIATSLGILIKALKLYHRCIQPSWVSPVWTDCDHDTLPVIILLTQVAKGHL